MKGLLNLFIAGALIAGSGGAALAQQSTPQSSGAKQDVKNAGKDTKNAAKSTGKAVKKTTKKVVHKGAKATSKGADKVQDKTAPNK
jgi:hypothetical protein